MTATGSQTVGPFFHVGPGATDRLGCIAPNRKDVHAIRLRIRVLDGDAAPVPDALVELWQADAHGRYSSSEPICAGPMPPFTGFGRLGTREDGTCEFDTVRPGLLPSDTGLTQAAHINVCVFARGLLRHLYTRVYFDGDVTFTRDPIVALVPEERRATLLARKTDEPATWEFVIRLQGEGETVFFDL
jgi:protocatechuate 3,4-dioxygenase alpha subunit